MKDQYMRPAEEQQLTVDLALKAKYGNLQFSSVEWIADPTSHLAIDDVSYRASPSARKAVQTITALCQGKLKIYPIDRLTVSLASNMESLLQAVNPSTTLLIYPGEGADTVRDLLPPSPLDSFTSIHVEAKRAKNPTTGQLEGIFTFDLKSKVDNVRESMNIQTVVVMDDVIDSGKTLKAVKQEADIEKASWVAGTPIMYSPLPYSNRDAASSIEGYDLVFSTIMLQGTKNPVVLNSLSSFLEEGAKAQRLIQKCLENYVNSEDQETFIKTLLQLQVEFRYNSVV